MLKYICKKINRNVLFILLIIIFTHLTDLYYNIYAVFIRDYEERMIIAYGDCGRESYGFVKKAYNLTKSQNLKIINFESHLWPNVNGLFNIVKKPVDESYLVLLNLKQKILMMKLLAKLKCFVKLLNLYQMNIHGF
jgi:hypothetical protein